MPRWKRAATGVCALLFILAVVFATESRLPRAGRSAATASHGRPRSIRYAGWAMEAYPGDSLAYLRSEMQRQIRAGSNVVWLGHDNPGEVGYDKREPGLSYAVWAAARDRRSVAHGAAVAMIEAQRRVLEAARSLGVRVVLPIGYQIQMGSSWNRLHPSDLRRLASGSLYDASGGPNLSASFYAPDYRRDILAYYRWVEATFVRPYRRTILMLNLADEPEDGDYSFWANKAFGARSGFGLLQAGASPARQETVGRFESDYVVDYAAWSARQWLAIDPRIAVTMSFCGGYSRAMHEGPNLEDIFRRTPRNFVVTFDAYPRDGLYTTPLTDGDLISLFALVRTLGYDSGRYHRALWLWPAANSWGLNEASADPGGVADAVSNGIYLALLARQSGGELEGLAFWNYNIRAQGLYNDTHRLTYNPDTMFARVSASFPLLRRIMSLPPGQVHTIVLAPDAPVLRSAGAQLALRARDPYRWQDLAALARGNVAAPIVTRLDPSEPGSLRAAVVLARSPSDLTQADRAGLRRLLASGGTVVAAGVVARLLGGEGAGKQLIAGDATGTAAVWRMTLARGTLLAVEGASVEDVLADRSAGWAAPVWRRLAGSAPQTSAYTISLWGVTLVYSIARGGATVVLDGPEARPGRVTLYGRSGARRSDPFSPRQPGPFAISIGRRSYALALDG